MQRALEIPESRQPVRRPDRLVTSLVGNPQLHGFLVGLCPELVRDVFEPVPFLEVPFRIFQAEASLAEASLPNLPPIILEPLPIFVGKLCRVPELMG